MSCEEGSDLRVETEGLGKFSIDVCVNQTWPELFAIWITLSVLLTLIHAIAIYPVDSVIQPSNNWGLVGSFVLVDTRLFISPSDLARVS